MRKHTLRFVFIIASFMLTTSITSAESNQFSRTIYLEKGKTSIRLPFQLVKNEDILVMACNYTKSTDDIQFTLYQMNQGSKILVANSSLEHGTAYGYKLPNRPAGMYLFEITSPGTCKAEGKVLVIDSKEPLQRNPHKKPIPPTNCCPIL